MIFVRPLLTRAEDVAGAIAAAAERLPSGLPVLAVFMSAQPELALDASQRVPVPRFLYPEDAARALARASAYAEWRRRPRDEPRVPEAVRPDEAAAMIAEALGEGREWLRFSQLSRLLGCYGIPLAPWRHAASPAQVEEVARELGGAVAVKAVGGDVLHKTEAGAVRLGLDSPIAARGAAVEIDRGLSRSSVEKEGFVVQSMVEPGVEMLIGVVGDPVFGPVVACGAGGVQAELLKDVNVRLTPLSGRDASEMIRSLRTFPLLTGYRGSPKAKLEALEELLLRLSALVEGHRELAELDLNPVIAGPRGAVAVDARVRVAPSGPVAPWPSA